ncbi:hypothetical protein AALO_G00069660 [Alosa alosa]|uniref:Laminin EGF-like domain-containing protein n=1 Tax=Alosa alosa TaxID=278164 RepID=A0AAV6H6N4_9TELE|nr:multiple epidermal growth factor-like domains protein 9 [Alosa alosa]KAG5281302.1 hypothetical protein AALO_G00069660 [Alosa alosa]
MWWFPLIMFTSPTFPFILFVCIGLSEAAPRIISNDALSITRNNREVSDTVLGRLNLSNRTYLSDANSGRFRFSGLTPAPTILSTDSSSSHVARTTVTTVEPPTTDPTTPSVSVTSTVADLPAVFDRQISDRRSADSVPSLAPQSKTLQKSQENSDRSPLLPASENSQELVCNCSGEGVHDPEDCDPSTGQCLCLPGYAGLQCEECEEAHFTNGTSGCLPCGCDSFGAINELCDSSGTCVCKIGVYGPKCDDCHPGFFHFSSSGCQPCECNNHTVDCHPQSGGCLDCQGNTQGQNCEECVPGFYRRPGEGVRHACVLCPCSNLTSSGSCHLDFAGQTVCDKCKAGFGGGTCDICRDGYYRSGGVCVRCECNGNADARSAPRLCHPDTGHCLSCANNTAGQHCELCAPGYVGNARTHNCTLRARVLPGPELTTKPSPPLPAATSSPPQPSSSSRDPAPPPASSTTTRTTTMAQALLPSLAAPTRNSTAAALTVVSWTQFNVVVLAVIIAVVVLLMGFVAGVYTYREYRNRKLNAPFWTIELKEDNISFSSYHDSIPNADPAGLLEEDPCPVAPNGQLALTTTTTVPNMYTKA